jgi:hypothetical protein
MYVCMYVCVYKYVTSYSNQIRIYLNVRLFSAIRPFETKEPFIIVNKQFSKYFSYILEALYTCTNVPLIFLTWSSGSPHFIEACCKSFPLVHILSQMNEVHALPSVFLRKRFNIVIPEPDELQHRRRCRIWRQGRNEVQSTPNKKPSSFSATLPLRPWKYVNRNSLIRTQYVYLASRLIQLHSTYCHKFRLINRGAKIWVYVFVYA